jgi:hypothetical protein
MRDAGAVERVTRRKIVAAVEHDVGVTHPFIEPRAGEPFGDRVDFDFGVQPGERVPRRFGLRDADAGVAMNNLALQVGEIDGIVVADRQRADAGRSQIQRGGRAQPAGADDQSARARKFFLAFDAEFRQQDVPAVAQELIVIHMRINSARQARGSFSLVRLRGKLNAGRPGKQTPGKRPGVGNELGAVIWKSCA